MPPLLDVRQKQKQKVNMFTINHVESNGYESLRQVQGVQYYRDSNKVDVWGLNIPPTTEEVINISFGNGIVYVMNENGKTVAKYDLGG